MGTEAFDTTSTCQSSRLLWKTSGKLQPRSNRIFWWYCHGGRDIDTPLRCTQPTRNNDVEEIKRKDTNPTTSHMINWQFFSSIFYHVVLQSMVHLTHYSFIGCVLLFERNVARNLSVMCCFTTIHLFTSPTSHRLHQTESSCIFSRSCTQWLSSVLKSEEFSSWQEFSDWW